jgi:hypothetical protein
MGRKKLNLGEIPTRREVAETITNALPNFKLQRKEVEVIAEAVVRLYQRRQERKT